MADTQSQDQRYQAAAVAYGGAIDRIARGYEADAELRRDLVQDIHAQLWRSFAYFERQCAEKSWVYRIAHNVAVTHVMARRRLKGGGLVDLDAIEELPAPDDAERDIGQRTLVDSLLATIHRLKPADRQVMLLYLEDLSAAEIGEVTGMSPGAVAVRIHRVKALLAAPYAKGEPQ